MPVPKARSAAPAKGSRADRFHELWEVEEICQVINSTKNNIVVQVLKPKKRKGDDKERQPQVSLVKKIVSARYTGPTSAVTFNAEIAGDIIVGILRACDVAGFDSVEMARDVAREFSIGD